MTFKQLHTHHWSPLKLKEVLCFSFLFSDGKLVESSRETYFVSIPAHISLWTKLISLKITSLFCKMGTYKVCNAKTFYYFHVWISVPCTATKRKICAIDVNQTLNTGFQSGMHCDFEIQGEKAYEKKIPNWLRMLEYQDWALIHWTSFWLVNVYTSWVLSYIGFVTCFPKLDILCLIYSVLIWPHLSFHISVMTME